MHREELHVKNWYRAGLALVFVALAVACGGAPQQPAEVSADQAGEEDGTKTKDVLSESRRDETLGEGGQFVFTTGEQSFTVDWGYADFRYFQASKNSRLTLLSNPVGGDKLPLLRIYVPSEVTAVEEFIGKTVEAEKINLKLEKKKQSGVKGTAQVTIKAISDGFIEGSFTGQLENGESIEGTFKARLFLPE